MTIFRKLYNKKKGNIAIVHGWQDDLIGCPSQCYLHLTFKGWCFVLYLRWRHSDPWTAELIQCNNDDRWSLHDGFKWIKMPVKFYSHADRKTSASELKELKKDAIQCATQWLRENIKDPAPVIVIKKTQPDNSGSCGTET